MRKWFCMRCMEEHAIVDGVIQCSYIDPPFKPLISQEQFIKDWRYVARRCNVEDSEKPHG